MWRVLFKVMSNEVPFTAGSGDIFRDFGFSDEEATVLAVKANLFHRLQKAFKETAGTQIQLAQRLGVSQPKIADILNGKMAEFSVDCLEDYLSKLRLC